MTNEPLTAEEYADEWFYLSANHYESKQDLVEMLEAYAAQEVTKATAGLEQHNTALIPLAAWAKKHGHSMFCDMRSAGVIKSCHCTCGWVDAHQNHGLTTDQHLALAEYSDAHYAKGSL